MTSIGHPAADKERLRPGVRDRLGHASGIKPSGLVRYNVAGGRISQEGRTLDEDSSILAHSQFMIDRGFTRMYKQITALVYCLLIAPFLS